MSRTDPSVAELVIDPERLALAAASACCGLWGLDVTTGGIWVTGETRCLYGLAPGEPATWDGFVSLLHPDDRDELVERVKAVIATEGGLDERYRIVRPDGVVRWLHVTARMDGPTRLLGASIDETERVEAELLAKDQETRVLAAASAAGLGFSEWSTTARPYLDARCRDLVGVGLDQLDEPRALWLSRIHDEDRPRLEEASRRLRAGETDHVTMEYRSAWPGRAPLLLAPDAALRARSRRGCVRGSSEFGGVQPSPRPPSHRGDGYANWQQNQRFGLPFTAVPSSWREC